MALSPISLDEARSHLNFEESDGHAFDDELWATVLAATEMVEQDLGPIRPRTVTATVRPTGRGTLFPRPPILSVASVTAADGGTVEFVLVGDEIRPATRLCGVAYTVVYVAGLDPIPDDCIEAVELQTGLLWSSQRGPSSSRFSALGGDGISSPGGLDRKRLDYILAKRCTVLVR